VYIRIGEGRYQAVKKFEDTGVTYYRDSKNWTLEFWERGKRRRRTSKAHTLKGAEAELRAIVAEVDSNSYVHEKSKAPILFREYVEPYFRRLKINRKNRESTMDVKGFYLRKVLPHFGAKFADQISVHDIEEYVEKREAEVSTATVNRELSLISNMFSEMKKDGYVARNPVSSLGRNMREDHRIRVFKEGERERLLEAVDGQLEAMVLTTLMTGLRKGELLNLRWDDINFRDEGGGYHLRVRESKTTAGERVIPFNETLKEIFLTHYNGGAGQYEYVFTISKGKRIKSCRTAWETALRSARIEGFRWHDLRHQFGTDMISQGMDIGTLKNIMGHKDVKTTMIYCNPGMMEKRNAMGNMEGFFESYRPHSVLKPEIKEADNTSMPMVNTL